MCQRCHYPRPDDTLRGICSRCGYHGSIWIVERHTLSTLTHWRIERWCSRCITYSFPARTNGPDLPRADQR